MVEIEDKLNYAHAIAEWLLELGDIYIRLGNFENALKFNQVAGHILASQNRDLVSARIESNLRLVASRLVEQGIFQHTPMRTGRPQRCLHVLSEALPAGGLTAMAIRWIKNDGSGRVHDVALLSQEVSVPAPLRQAVDESGGRIHAADPATSLVNRAVWLRQLAAENANYVILHVDVADVISGVAFGVPGGPPIMLVNHTAHLFWLGASTADRVVNCRGSELEVFWSAVYRGIGYSRCSIVPIPLLDPKSPDCGSASKLELKRQSRRTLGIEPDATVILTVGSFFKYLPVGDLNFLEIWGEILKAVPEAMLLAVGFYGDQRWKDASARLGNRIRTLGTMPYKHLLMVQNAADLYVEAFPFGTTTSLLECGINGIPVGLAPVQSPPPYGTDGIAIDEVLQRPATIEEYKARMIQLCRSVDERAALCGKLREPILRHHSGAGWRQHLETALKSLPQEHTIFPEIKPARTPTAIHEYWSLFVPQCGMGYENALEIAVTRALSLGLRPRLTDSVRQACRDHRALRSFRTIPMPVLALLVNVVLPFLPAAWSSKTFRVCVFAFRGSFFLRLRKKIARSIGLCVRQAYPYQEYRQMRDAPEFYAKSGRRPATADRGSGGLPKCRWPLVLRRAFRSNWRFDAK